MSSARHPAITRCTPAFLHTPDGVVHPTPARRTGNGFITCVAGGPVADPSDALFVHPTVCADVTRDMRLAQHEVFAR